MYRRYAVAAVLALMCATPVLAQQKASGAAAKPVVKAPSSAYLDALRKNTTTAGKVALAEAAGPVDIARRATIIEILPENQSKTLRAGTNGWTCIADPKGPMCLDDTFTAFINAYLTKMAPSVSKVAVAYMLVGDEGASLSDPYATAKTADWVKSGPHLMLILPDASQLQNFPDNPSSGGPYVMWKGTPYAHLMVPVSR